MTSSLDASGYWVLFMQVLSARATRAKNEKIMRRIVRAVLSDTDLGDLSSLVNPAAIDELRVVAAASRDLRERHKDLD